MAAECTSESITVCVPDLGFKLLVVKATKAAINDYITLTGYTVRAVLFVDVNAGTADTYTRSTNVVTLTSATTGTVYMVAIVE